MGSIFVTCDAVTPSTLMPLKQPLQRLKNRDFSVTSDKPRGPLFGYHLVTMEVHIKPPGVALLLVLFGPESAILGLLAL